MRWDARTSPYRQPLDIYRSITSLSNEWSALHIGVAYTDLTFAIVEYLERQTLDYVSDPIVEGGYLSLEVAPRPGQTVESIQVYRYEASTVENDLRRVRLLSVFEPPELGTSTELPDDTSIVADFWAVEGETIRIAAAVGRRLGELGTYELLIWTDQILPGSQYFLSIDDPGQLELDESAKPFQVVQPPSLEELRAYALELINADRETHGVPPVLLGTNSSAQVHAQDAVDNGYLVGHWTADGMKPYMLYRLAGGHGVVAENAAGSGFEVGQCQKPLVVCAAVDAKEQIAGHQFSMMYDDAHADWGHRDTIINPNYDTVNIGIAIDGHRIAFYQHFEYTGLEYTDEPLIEGGRLRLAARPLDGHSIGAVAVYYDPSPVGKQPPEIQSLDAYCYGGGFTDECDGVRPIAVVLEPPPPGSQYRDLRPEQVISDVWNERGDGVVEIEADLGSLVGDPGVYTVVVQSGSEPGRLLSGYSIFK